MMIKCHSIVLSAVILSSHILDIARIWCEAYATGAPPESCGDMEPKHGNFVAQTTPSPFRIKSFKLQDNRVIVTIDNCQGRTFKGFMLAAVEEKTNRIVPGQFTAKFDVQLVDCPSGNASVATHVNSEDKSFLLVEWTPIEDFVGNLFFRATVVVNGAIFWTNLESPPETFP